ncbi:MAG: 1-acyl-sn-glycerol-3-phosphate acyltransferase, partial [Acholeplasmataceae bacterium]|nr:1-acyl-sn-glycerol-3-phosphate acyltransferase [Acholeplasmataceae bacterium]
KQFKPNYFVKFLRKAFFYLFAAPIIYLYIKITLNTKYIDRYKARPIKKSKRGGIVVVNHVHNLDAPMSAHVTWPKKEIYTTLPENLTNRKYGFLVKLLDGVPIPTTVSETKIFFYILAKEMRKGKLIHFYPEGHLIKECDHLRPFKNGAFTLAADNDSPILPIVIKFVKKEKGFRKRKTLVITGDPIYPNANLRKRDLARQLKEEAFNQMNEMLNKDYD